MGGMMDENSIINIRQMARERLAAWFKSSIIDPQILKLKKEGLSESEINLALNKRLFDAFSGLHSFPNSQRPK